MRIVKHCSASQILSKSLFFLFVLVFGFSGYSQEVDVAKQKEGAKIFKSLCSSCHKLNKKSVGPALENVEERRSKDWLYKWIRNNAEFRATGDKDAVAIFEEYKGAAMSAFPQLTDEQLDAILYYTKVGPAKKKVVAAVAGTDPAGDKAPAWVMWILAAAVVAGIFVIASLLKTISELKGGPKTPGVGGQLAELWIGIKKNTFLQIVTVIFFALVGAYFLFGTLFKIGVDQGYQPIQPIQFSHKIHAGDNKIECQYCHSAAKHSKHSGIPSVNICMNCHKNISEVSEDTKLVLEDRVLGKEELDAEIQKVYKAAGWDSENLEYTGRTRKIEWVRIHNLPDFAYFNHSQHVKVAGVDCQKCHGPIEKMEEVYQYSPLTMGWCIDCHKETKVDLKGNEYYAKIHKELAEKYGVESVTIAQLGGKECGKCHY